MKLVPIQAANSESALDAISFYVNENQIAKILKRDIEGRTFFYVFDTLDPCALPFGKITPSVFQQL